MADDFDDLDDTEAPEPKGIGIGPEDFRQATWLAQRLRGRWKYDHTASQWHHFDGTRWAPDRTKQAHKAIHRVAVQALGNSGEGSAEQKRLFSLLQWPVQERVLKALSTFEGYGTAGDEWDSNPNLIGCKNGVLDLRKNALVPASPEQNVTKTTKHDFEPIDGPEDFDRVAPVFMKSLREWTSDYDWTKNDDLTYFLLFWFGASLFGSSPEERFLLMTGRGRNGKGSVMVGVLAAAGEYADELDPALYMRSRFGSARSNEARADLIKLKGLRITFFSEPAGGTFNEELLKAHTGNDRISARALYSNNIQTWEPTHSINFLTNDLPSVEDVGPSMGSRVMVADFRHVWEPGTAGYIASLKEDIKKEGAGILSILAWAASIWYARYDAGLGGLVLPQRVIDESKAFMELNDPIANWLEERCERRKDAYMASQLGYDSYIQWHTQSGAPGEAFSMVRWSAAMQKKGFEKKKTETGMRWSGVRVLSAIDLADRGIDEDEEP